MISLENIEHNLINHVLQTRIFSIHIVQDRVGVEAVVGVDKLIGLAGYEHQQGAIGDLVV